jgi:hypothetical protein
VEVLLAQPPPREGLVELSSQRSLTVSAGGKPSRHGIDVTPRDGVVEFSIEGDTHRPSSDHPGSRDHRDLGPIFFELSFTPESDDSAP